MSNGVADSAVGAILEIPDSALRNIEKAEKAIWSLHDASKKAANQIYGDFSKRMPMGIDVFINKLAEAKRAMDGLGTINVTLNTQAAVQSTEQLSTATQKTSQDVSKAVQDMAASWNDLAKVSIKSFDLSAYGENLTEALARLSELKGQFKNEAFGGANNQAMADEIRQIEEAIRLYKQASDEKNKALSNIQQKQQAQTDKAYLDEQKRLLDRILQLRKDIANISISVQRGTITGKEDMSKDLAQLEQLRKELRETGVAYKDLRLLASLRLSDEGKVQSEIISQNAKNAGLRQEIDERNKLNQAITRANELTAQGQQGKTRLGSGEEAAIQRQLNSDYKAMIGIIREQGDLKAKVASEGRQMTQQEIDLIASLAQRYKIYYDDIQRVATAYSKMSEAAAKNFQADKSEQLARNAILLADAQNKAAEAAQKVADAQAKAAQQQADKDRSQAESELNRLYTERLRLLKEKEQLENKALVNNAKGLPDLTAKENQLLTELTAKLQSVDNQIQTIGNSYRGLAIKAQHAFALDELRQATALQNQFNKALESVDTSKTKQLVAEYKKLYEENQKLYESMRKYYNEAGGTPTTATTGTRNVDAAYREIEARHSEVLRHMRDLESKNIQEIADFRMQKDVEANQRSISEFVQAEAQKTARAKQEAEQQSNDRIQAYQKFLNTYQGAMAAANRLGTRGGQWEDTYENRARVIKNLEAAIKSLNKADADYEWKLKELTDALKRLKDAQKEVNDVMKQKPQVTLADANQARKIAEQTKTLKDYETAYKLLIEVMKQTPQGRAWDAMNRKAQEMKTHIDEIKKKMDEFQSQTNRTSNVMGQLQSRIAAAFSVGAIMGFLKKMVEVRAQFELQRVALGAIIQDRDEANKIFTQVQNMALESPFNIMQLEKATKQIAAFGFETKKLVPTMKMFADISAGLGVEIDRLVLVMGHLKARNFLEGTMVRQFTNMGFNVLGELSKYYTELEGKMVSVGEVQDRVKKKMVSFEDVEEVLKRVTSAGGMFYDMQKKQSESLWGQMQRITDAYDLMLNEIGQSNEGILKAALTTIRNLINHWRDLKPIIVATVAAMGTFGASMLILRGIPMIASNIARGFNMMGAALGFATKQQIAMNAAQKANAWGALLSAIVAVGVAIYEVATAQSKLNEELGRIENEGLGNMYNLIFQYRQLADTIKDTNKTYEERKEAMDEMKRVYGEILPDQMLEIEHIKEMKDGYNEATEAIKAHYEEKIKRQKEEAIKGDYEKDIKEQVEDAAERFTLLTYDAITEGMELENIPEETYKRNIENILTAIEKEIEDGITPAEEASKRFKEVLMNNLAMTDADYKKISQSIDLNKAFEDAFSHQDYHGNRFGKGYWEENSILSTLREMNDKIKEETESIAGNLNAFMAPDAEPYVKQYGLLTQAVNQYKLALESLYELQSKGKLYDENGELTSQGSAAMDSLLAKIEQINEAGQIFGINLKYSADDVNKAVQSTADKMEYFDKVNELTFGHVVNNFDTWGAKLQNNTYIKGLIEQWEKAKLALNMNEPQRKIVEFQHRIATATGVSINVFDRFRLESVKSYDAARKSAKSLSDEANNNIMMITATATEIMRLAAASGKAITWVQAVAQAETQHNVGTIEYNEQVKKSMESLYKALGGYEKESKKKSSKGSDKELKRWQDLKKAIESVQTAYEKARKSFTEDESNKMIEERWGSVFKALGADIKDFYKNGVYDMEALTKAYQVLIDKAQKAATTEDRKKYLSELIASQKDNEIELKVKLQEDSEKQLKKQLDDMFNSYDLSMEFKKAGINVDLIYMLGGKPITLEDVREELERLREEGGGDADAENRIKILEEAEKKLTQIELKEQKERLKNYEKYLKQAYSDSAKVQLEYFVKLQQMQEDFAKAEKDLRKQLADPETSAEDKLKIQKALENLPNQASRAARGMREEMEKELDKLNLDKLLKSPLFSEMFQDLGSMTNKVLDTMLAKIREIQNSANDLSLSQIRQLAQYAEKIENAKLDNSPFKEAYNAIKKAYELRAKGITAKSASDSLAVSEEELERLETLKNDISLILGIKEKSYKIDGDMVTVGATQYQLTAQQKTLLDENTSELNAQLNVLKDQSGTLDGSIKKQKQVVTVNAQNVQTFKNALTATEKLSNALKKAAEAGKEAINAVTAGMQLFGKEVSDADQEWLDFVGNMMDAGIELAIMFVALGATINNALGIIGIISTALTFVAGLFKAIFQSHDKRLEKEISKVQDRVDALSKGFERLQKSIERAFTIGDENRLTEQALNNLEAQKTAYDEMIRLEEAKKKSDDDKIKDYKEKLEELAEAEEELYEKRHEKWDSTNDVWDEANNWVDAWLDAYKETGDGLDALNDSWDEFYENLVKKQATSKVLGSRMDSWIKQINDAIDRNMGSEYDYIDLFKQIGEKMKAEFDATNADLKKIFEYAGIGGGKGELILSDLQQGIQNITEPQAAAIEAYLNSMRFEVFRHTEQLERLITAVQMQYGGTADNPVVTELKGIRNVLDSIDSKFDSVIGKTGIQKGIRIAN